MIEEQLIQWGVQGVFIAYLILDNRLKDKKYNERELRIINVIENNTVTMSKVHEVIETCRKK
jgi:hypothetical protein